MSLLVWLPLTQDLRNNGLSDITVTNSGATINDNGKLGKCYYFDGTDDRISCSSLSVQFPMSISGWFKPTNVTSTTTQYWISYNTATGGTNGQSIAIGTYNGVPTAWFNGTVLTLNTTLSNNTWYHIAVTVDINKTVTVYINGVSVGTSSYTGTQPSSLWITLGARSNSNTGGVGGASYYYKGYMNDARFYDHCLSAKEVELLSRGLVCHYPLEEANNTLLPFGYQQLEYIESTGASAFDTKYKFNPETDSLKMIFKGNDVSNNGMLFGQSAGQYFWLYYYGSNGIRVYAYNGSSQEGISGIPSDLVKHTAEFKNKHYIIDGVDKGGLSNTYTEATYSSWMFSYGSATYCFKGRIYYAQIGRNGKVQRTFIPAKRLSDSKIGMYELNTNEFFASGTSTAFTAGDVVGTPTTIHDCSGYENNGSINGSLIVSNDTTRYSASTYIPKAGYIQHPNALRTDNANQEWTCCAWVKLTSTDSSQYLNNFNLGNMLRNSSTPLLYLNSGTHDYYMYGSVALSTDTWTHIAFVFKNSTGLRNVYINGELKNSYGPNKDSTPAGIPSTITVFGGNFDGYVSDYREYATALSDTQIAELYNTAATIDKNGTLLGYEFVEV